MTPAGRTLRIHGLEALTEACRVIAAHRAGERAMRQAETRLAALARTHGLALSAALRSSHAEAKRIRRLQKKAKRHGIAARRALARLAVTRAYTVRAVRAQLVAAALRADDDTLAWTVVRSAAADLRHAG